MKNHFIRMGSLLLFVLFSTTAWAQVSGTVTDADGIGLPGVNIIVVGTSSGTVTDLDGNYSITAADDATLRFSYTGFSSQEIAIGSRSSINITLTPDAELIDEIVVIGYGQQSKESVTGAISSVGAEEISAVTTPNLGEALQGRLAGVTVTGNGAPGTAPEIQVRGIGSISFGSGPLFVVDGVPGAGGLNQFDSRDIKSATVLKDASATAIYGSRASNGVILITTKTGNKGQPIKLSFESTFGVQSQPRRYDLMGREQYLDYAEIITGMPLARNLNEAVNSQTSQTYGQTDTDWQDALFQNGLMTQNSLQLAGGSDRSTFFSSFGYLQQEGAVIGSPYERFNFRINSNHDLSESGRFRFGQTLLLVNDKRRVGPGNLFRETIQSIPYQPVFNPDNIGGFSGASQSEDSADPRNPILAATLVENTDRVLRAFGTLFLEYDILDGLTARTMFSANYNVYRNYNRNPIFESTLNSVFNTISESRSNSYSPLYSTQLTYDKLFGDHNLNATVVGEIQESYGSFVQARSDQTTNRINVVQGGENPAGTSSRGQTVLQSVVGRVSYGYKGKYLVTASFRRDGSSIFAPGNQIEVFPAAAVAWRISEEPFLQSSSVSELKVRASYGRTGSVGLGPYSFQAPINSSIGAVIGGNQLNGSFINDLANGDLSWEVTDMLNIGADIGFLNNRLNFSAEFYDREVDNLILNTQLAPSLGPDGTRENVGAMRNTGFELQGQYYSNRSKEFTWNVTANFSTNTNEVLRLNQEGVELFFGQSVAQGFTGDVPPTVVRVGDPVFSFYGYQTMGLFQSQDEIDSSPTQENAAPGDVRFVDTNGDGEITDGDRVVLGSYLPDFTYGFNFSGKWRNFDVNLFFQGSQGNDVYNGVNSLLFQTTRLFNGSPDRLLNAWSPTNTGTDIPRIALEDPNNNRRMSDRFLEDGSYLRLKNLTIGYKVPFGGGSAISSLRLYVSGQNLLTLTGYSGLDPEVGRAATGLIGFDNGRYPQARTFLLGAQVGF